jgi:hypothetical protein
VSYTRKYRAGDGFIAFLLVAVLIIVMLLVILGISTAIIFFGWNLGIVALVAACGGTVSKISFWTAFFIGIAISVVRGLFTSA